MRKLTTAAVLAALAAGMTATSAVAASGGCRELMTRDDPPQPTGTTVCREDDWFHAGDSQLGNQPNATTPSWSTTKPTGSFPQAGAVYGTARIVDIFDTGNPSARPTFTGTYTGTLDNVALTVFSSSLYSATGAANAILGTLVVDGKTVWNDDATGTEYPVNNEPVDQRTTAMRFAFTNMAASLRRLRVANTATTKHTITVSFVNKYWGDSNFLMYYDSADYPSGITFNAEPDPDSGTLSGYTEMDTDGF